MNTHKTLTLGRKLSRLWDKRKPKQKKNKE